jgi:hypothetical protein
MRTTPLTLLTAVSTLALALALGGCGEGDQTEKMEERAQTEQGTTAETAAEESRLERAKTEAVAAAAKLQEAGQQAGAAAADAAGSAVDTVKAKAAEAAAGLKEAGEQAGAAAAAAAKAASDKTAELTTAMTQKGGELGHSASEQAEELITQVQDYLKQNDLDSAQGIMDKLGAIKDELPRTLQQQIGNLREKMADMAENETAG